ncbi:COX15/CtaA family protein [Rhabdothermincola sediminis]|uniref:COX15/CtaA family protein n=1 Tax=Rhabdothermincola sediminis TaxID=2751370 RepID=UPI001AA00E5E|nr:COX15/CtaA family protein [Rhabdothermincola sediminis]
MYAPLRRLPRLSPRAYQRITLLALLALAFIVVTGAAVRLTGSGLGCSDWPTCEQGRLVAPLEYHAMVEFVNRTITGVVSVAVILAVLGSLAREPRRRDLTWWSLGLVAGVLAQIVLGGIVVLLHLAPLSVIGHFLLSIVLLWNAVVLHERASNPAPATRPLVPTSTIALGRATVAAALAVVVAGTIVTATGPHGGDERAERLQLEISEVTRLHAIAAWLFLVLAMTMLWRAYRSGVPTGVRRRGAVLVGAIVIQGVIGYTQYFTGVPPLLVGLHVLGAVVVWVATLRFHLALFAPAEPTPLRDLDLRAGLPMRAHPAAIRG